MRFLPTESSFNKTRHRFPQATSRDSVAYHFSSISVSEEKGIFLFSLWNSASCGLLKPVYIVKAMEIYVCKLMPIIFVVTLIP